MKKVLLAKDCSSLNGGRCKKTGKRCCLLPTMFQSVCSEHQKKGKK